MGNLLTTGERTPAPPPRTRTSRCACAIASETAWLLQVIASEGFIHSFLLLYGYFFGHPLLFHSFLEHQTHRCREALLRSYNILHVWLACSARSFQTMHLKHNFISQTGSAIMWNYYNLFYKQLLLLFCFNFHVISAQRKSCICQHTVCAKTFPIKTPFLLQGDEPLLLLAQLLLARLGHVWDKPPCLFTITSLF